MESEKPSVNIRFLSTNLLYGNKLEVANLYKTIQIQNTLNSNKVLQAL